MTRSMIWFLILAFAVGLACGLWRSRRHRFAVKEVAIATTFRTLLMAWGAVLLFLSYAALRFSSSGPVPAREALVAFPVFAVLWMTIVGLWSCVPVLAGSVVGLGWRLFVKRPREQDDFETPPC
jgi:uncharacterized membrane protein